MRLGMGGHGVCDAAGVASEADRSVATGAADAAGVAGAAAQRLAGTKRGRVRRVLAAVVAGALAVSAFAFAGCGSSEGGATTEPDFEVADIEVAQSGYTLSDDGTLRFAFTATNPNEGHLAHNVVFSLEAYDSEGHIVAGAGVTVPLMYPGHTEAACGSTQVYANTVSGASASQAQGSSVDVAYIQVSPVMDSVEWSDTSYDEEQLEQAISIDRTSKSGKAGGDMTVNAEVSTTLSGASFSAVVLLLDAEGNPTCGSDTVSFECSEGEQGSVSVSIADAPEHETCYIYVSPQFEL